MHSVSQRESVLLGYSPQRTSMSSSSSPSTPQQRSSDVDFTDVFGGPPRRLSIKETRYSFNENADSYSLRRNDEAAASRDPWSSLNEKPVFGEEGASTRRYTSGDFFDDIFKVNDCSSSSPRRYSGDTFSLSPGVPVLSPARPLPPKAEPFGSSFPAQFSLPAKLNRGMDLPTFGSAPGGPYSNKDSSSNGSSCYSYSPLSRFSSLANQSQDEMRNGASSSHRQRALSQEASLGSEESANLTKSDEIDTGGNSKKDSNSSNVLKTGNQFHFSIYKWASKGIPLDLPLRGGNSSRVKEKGKLERSSSYSRWLAREKMESPTATTHDIKFGTNEKIVAATKSSAIEHENKDYLLFNIGAEDLNHRQIVKEAIISHSDSEAMNTLSKELKNVYGDDTVSHDTVEDTKAHSLPDIGNEEMTKNADIQENTTNSTKKKKDGKSTNVDGLEVGKISMHCSPRNSRDHQKSRVKGKVKEFVKIFNQETSSKPRIDVGSQSQSSRRKERHSFRAENEASIRMTQTDEKNHMQNMQEQKSYSDVSSLDDEYLEKIVKQKSTSNVTDHIYNGDSEQNAADMSNTIVGDPDESIEENILIKELIHDEKRVLPTSIDPEGIQVIDCKIRQWSNGKQGNIRSLLSTLQYVLWPDSGWKPVPLVDIIEGNAVKRSYQKALLCLHPDKLQQKGASSQQKYIAERVFDILQDAWTHYSSLGSV